MALRIPRGRQFGYASVVNHHRSIRAGHGDPNQMKELLLWPVTDDLLSAIVLHVLAHQTSPQGTTELETKTLLKALAWIVAAILGLGSWWYQLLKRDTKRAKIQSAHKMGRRIWTCTPEGVVTVMAVGSRTPSEKIEFCPKCKTKYEIRLGKG